MTVTAMIAIDQIAGTQSAADRDTGEFLSYASVDRADQFPFGKKIEQFLLDRADRQRPGVQPQPGRTPAERVWLGGVNVWCCGSHILFIPAVPRTPDPGAVAGAELKTLAVERDKPGQAPAVRPREGEVGDKTAGGDLDYDEMDRATVAGGNQWKNRSHLLSEQRPRG
jgi:hypothetical protein